MKFGLELVRCKFISSKRYGRDDSDGAYSIQQVTDAPTGFNNSLKITITTTDSSLSASQYGFVGQWIEGYNIADLSFGSASAKTLTLSFWVKGSVTGQFGGSVTNSAQDRSYPFSYTILASNTWEQKTVTVTGDTTGTWLTTNGAGIGVNFAVGIGSNFLSTANAWIGSFEMSATGQTNLYATSAATLQFTGVQLEQNTSATPFERRLYNQELANCQRYYEIGGYGNAGSWVTSTEALISFRYTTAKRATPTVSLTTTSPIIAEVGVANRTGSGSTITITGSAANAYVSVNGFSSATANRSALMLGDYVKLDAEL